MERAAPQAEKGGRSAIAGTMRRISVLLAAFLCAASVLAAEEAVSDVQRIAGELERAKRKAAYGEWLYTEGVLAKSEAEEGRLLVVRLKKDLEDARWRQAIQEAEAQQKRFDNREIGKDANDKAQADLAAAAASANTATLEWKRAELDAALLNLKRQQKLYAEGVASKAEVRHAEEAVAALKGRN